MTFYYEFNDDAYSLLFMRDLWLNDDSTDGMQHGTTFPEYVARTLRATSSGDNDFTHACLTRAECARVADRISAKIAGGGKCYRPRAEARDARGDSASDLFPNYVKDGLKTSKSKKRHVYGIRYITADGDCKLMSVCASSKMEAYHTAISSLDDDGNRVSFARVASVTFGNGNYRAFNTTYIKPY